MATDQAAKRAWMILAVLATMFMLGLVMVSFWGGPYESDSWWNHTAPPTFPN
ncbi:MAG: hypothetical protein MK101_02390 [Phycisphaerales bacterium]|nr:hypothetical protein [Phycisphaerales bacterium]